MSHTYKDRAYWVVNHEHGIIDHDHSTGTCLERQRRATAIPRSSRSYSDHEGALAAADAAVRRGANS